MESIYKTFWGGYIDLDKLICVTCYVIDDLKEMTVYLDFQGREKTMEHEIDLYDFDIDENNNEACLAGEKVRFNNNSERSEKMWDYLLKSYERFVEDWRKYKNYKEKSTEGPVFTNTSEQIK